ncbi:MAG: glycosyltransferase [Candidatus Omnitrophota bacterium]
MKILFLTRDVPYPTNNGYRKRNYYLLKELYSRGMDIFLVTRGAQSSIDKNAYQELKTLCRDIVLIDEVESKTTLFANLFKSVFSLNAFSSIRRYSGRIKAVIEQLINNVTIDTIVCDSIYQSLNIPRTDTKTILYEHNVESQIIKRYLGKEKNVFKKLFAFIEYLKMERFQKKTWERFNHVIACSSLDKKYIKEKAPAANVITVNNGVDIDYFSPLTVNRTPSTVNRKPLTDNRKPSTVNRKPLTVNRKPSTVNRNTLIYTGQIGWFPNEDAVLYFTKEIYPAIKREVPGCHFIVVGADPSPKIVKLGEEDDTINVTGYVDDVRTYMNRARVHVVPLRIGGGTRLKILEALSMGIPVVSTSIGCEGLGLEDNEQILIRDNPKEFAKAVLMLMKDDESHSRLSRDGRKFVEENYDWSNVFGELDEILKTVKGERFTVNGTEKSSVSENSPHPSSLPKGEKELEVTSNKVGHVTDQPYTENRKP